ncbi:MAG TPA: Calx-beta domain-containing protein [Thermoanaerobaculia bacterium]|nr:Calx-beta domain-containing protein [Thermoanaerobaculia bacterium]
MKTSRLLSLLTAVALLLALPLHADRGGNGKGNGSSTSILKFDQRTFMVRENVGEAVISVERSKGEDGAVSVAYSTAPGSATPGEDYEPVSGVLTWDDGDGARKTFTIPILQDDDFEVRETIRLVLGEVEGAELHPGKGQAVLMILDVPEDNPGHGGGDDSDDPGVVRFAEHGFQAIEGSDGEAVIAVERAGGSRGAVTVEYATADGSATAGEDYTAAAGVLSWAGGEKGVKTFTVPVLQDDVEEGNEQVTLTLAAATGAVLDDERAEAVLTILDDDGSTEACVEDAETLCLAADRFQVRVDWRTAAGDSGHGTVEEVSDSSGLVWFFREENKEMLIKVIDACATFDTYWVFFAAVTNVDFTVTVTDTATGIVKEYTNTAGTAAEPVQDTFSFQTCGE